MDSTLLSPQREVLAHSPVPAQRRRPRRSRHLPLYLSIAPFYLLFLVFGLTPVLFSLYLAFQKWDGISSMRYIGFNNFSYLLTDTHFWQAIGNTILIWLMATIPTLGLALISAFLLNTSIRHTTLYKLAFFLPHVTSVVAIAIIFSTLFGNQFGLLNALITALGGGRIPWLLNPLGIKFAIACMIIWRATGYNAIIYLAGLQSIPKVLYEAARIDGAHSLQIFKNITLPLLRPIILFTVITSTISGLQVFTEPQVLVGPNGGPGASGMTMVLYLYQQAFSRDRFGYGSAVGWGMFVIIVAFSILNWKIVQRAGTR
ncbi:carbohydrate ABC transporter permease [Tengunoibacter tsumagoiensis]|uniref:Cytochrome c biogenesis protein n=1 Tax=Tengunoibacter tsumagoiensis TaxID=2014871 RepID=A0A402A6E4_9CHLR|nr:sugar ABC transporter permease [Tengunoibacter tsumagoiensis]GCE14713.1 cytochrome c biogenesis protein [Tengunoibacter tsumagoiensis]